MSIEVLAIIISAAGLLITLGGGLFVGFAWMLRRMDDQSIEVREEFRVVREDLHQLRGELTEVTISVARLEGPRERLILPHGSTSQ